VTLVVADRLRSCMNRVSRVFGANVSLRKEMRAGDAASVWIFFRFKWYCNDVPEACLEDE